MPVDVFNFPSPSQIHVTLILPRFPAPLALSLLCAPAASFPTSSDPRDSRRQVLNKLGSFYSHCTEPVAGLAPLPACQACLINCGDIWPLCVPP